MADVKSQTVQSNGKTNTTATTSPPAAIQTKTSRDQVSGLKQPTTTGNSNNGDDNASTGSAGGATTAPATATSSSLVKRVPGVSGFYRRNIIDISELESKSHFNRKEIEKLYTQYKKICDKRGLLDVNGFRQSMGILGMVQDSLLCQRLFFVFNTSKTGLLDFSEFVHGLGVLVKGTVDEKLDFAFAMTDIDGSGEITFEELQITVSSIMRIYSGIMGSNLAPMDTERIRAVFMSLDKNNDGSITKAEYKRGMKKHPEFAASLRGTDMFENESTRAQAGIKKRLKQYQRVADRLQLEISILVSETERLKEKIDSVSISNNNKSVNNDSKAKPAVVVSTNSTNALVYSDLNGIRSVDAAAHHTRKNMIVPPADSIQPTIEIDDTPTDTEEDDDNDEEEEKEEEVNDDDGEQAKKDVDEKNRKTKNNNSDGENPDRISTSSIRHDVDVLFHRLKAMRSTIDVLVQIGRTSSGDATPVSQSSKLGSKQQTANIPVTLGVVEEAELSPELLGIPGDSNLLPEQHLLQEENLASVSPPSDATAAAVSPPNSAEKASRQSPSKLSNTSPTLDIGIAGNSIDGSETSQIAQALPTHRRHGSQHSVASTNTPSKRRFGNSFSSSGLSSVRQMLVKKSEDDHLQSGSLQRTRGSSGLQNAVSAGSGSGVGVIPNQLDEPDDQESDIKIARYLQPASKGSTVVFGHDNWDLVINVMKGIQMAVGRTIVEATRPISAIDFSVKEKYTLIAGANLRPVTSSTRSAGQNADADISGRSCRFVDYAPFVFSRLRNHFGIDNEQYIHSIGPGNMLSNLMLGSLSSLSELGSEGKSGSFFYFTADNKYMVKTIRKDEHKLLRNILQQYYYHMTRSAEGGLVPESMLCRIVGCHVVRTSRHSKIGANKIYFVVMTNTLNTDKDIHIRYDLKGSWVGRRTKNAKDSRSTLKDLDFIDNQQKIRVGPERKSLLMNALRRDANFLESHCLIDYSLLLGIHRVKESALKSSSSSVFLPNISSGLATNNTNKDEPFMNPSSLLDLDGEVSEYVPPFFQQDMGGGMLSSDQSELYVMGVIDFLTAYSGKKRLERFCKITCLNSPDGISVMRQDGYARRFLKFMDKAIE